MTAVQQSIKPGKASKPTASAASPKNAVSWILLADALALMTDAYQNSWLAQQKLCRAFVESQVRTRAACAEGGWISEQGQEQWKEYEHNLRLSDLWRRKYFAPDGRRHTESCKSIGKTARRRWRRTLARSGYVLSHRGRVGGPAETAAEGYDLPQQQPAPAPQRKRGGGRPEQYEWDRVFAQFLRLIEDDGWPQIQSHREFAKRVCDACAEAGMEPTPSVDTVRDKISIWVSVRRR